MILSTILLMSALSSNPYLRTPDFEALSPTATRTLISIKTYQQTFDDSCAPAVGMMLLHKFLKLQTKDLTTEKERQIRAAMGTSAKVGTSPQLFQNWLSEQGFRTNLRSGGSLANLRQNLARKRLTAVEWIDWGGHWALVIGYDTLGTTQTDDDMIILADPADYGDDRKDGITYVNAERFESMWFDAQYFKPGTLVKGVMLTVEKGP